MRLYKVVIPWKSQAEKPSTFVVMSETEYEAQLKVAMRLGKGGMKVSDEELIDFIRGSYASPIVGDTYIVSIGG